MGIPAGSWCIVSRAELDAFIASRPDLERTAVRICYPELTTWQRRGEWPLARIIWLSDDGVEDECSLWESGPSDG